MPPKLTKINTDMAILRSVYGSGFVKRIGNVVGQKAGDGKYRITAYQPEVTNPRTDAQTTQRAKFSFLGKMAVMFGKEALAGLANTKFRTTQLAFISQNMPNVQMQVIGDPTQVDPVLSLRKVNLSAGGVITPVLTVEAIDETTMRVDADTRYYIDGARPTHIVVVALCLSEVTRNGYRAAVTMVPYAEFQDGVAHVDHIEMTVDVGSGATPQTGFPCVCYAYNVQITRDSLRTHYGNLDVYDIDHEQYFGAIDTRSVAEGRALFSKTVSQTINLQ